MPYLSAFILGPVFMIVEVIGEVFMPKFMSLIIDRGVLQSQDKNYIILMGLAMIGMAIVMMVGGILGAYFAIKASVNFAADLRKDVFYQVQNYSFANIEKFSTGSLVTRLTNDITNMQNVIAMVLRMMLRAPGMLIGALIMAITINAKLAVILLIVIPVLAVLIAFVMKIAFPRFDFMQTRIDHVNSILQENVTNVRVVKSFVRGDFEEVKFGEANQELKDSSIRALKIVIMAMPIMMLAMNITTIAVVWFGGKQILIGTMAIGELTAFTTYIVQILMSLMMLSMIMMQSSRAFASSKRIQEVLDETIDLTDNDAGSKEKLVTTGKIEFKNVAFRYYKNNETPVLENIDLTIEAGQTIGIIGSTGSGKTSLVQLIPRLYDVDEPPLLWSHQS